MSVKRNWGKPIDGVSWEDMYNITSGVDDLKIVSGFQAEDGSALIGVYDGSSAITLSNYNGFPIGTIIVDTQAFKLHMKTASTTWKSSAAFS